MSGGRVQRNCLKDFLNFPADSRAAQTIMRRPAMNYPTEKVSKRTLAQNSVLRGPDIEKVRLFYPGRNIVLPKKFFF